MSKYKIGDKVRIVSKPVEGNWTSSMDKWCGKVMTIKRTSGVFESFGISYRMEEDGGFWTWHDHMIEGLANTQEIHITVKGDETHAVLKENGKVIKHSIAKCHPEDDFDFEIGSKMVFERLFKHEYKVGEYVKNITGENAGHYLKKGSFGKIIRINPFSYEVEGLNISNFRRLQSLDEDDFKPANITDAEYEAQFKKFYNGKVVCVDRTINRDYTNGKIYQFNDGLLTTDEGLKTPFEAVCSFDEWQRFSTAKWLEIVED